MEQVLAPFRGQGGDGAPGGSAGLCLIPRRGQRAGVGVAAGFSNLQMLHRASKTSPTGSKIQTLLLKK